MRRLSNPLDLADAVECLRRLYRRVGDPNDAQFEVLTDVQAEALRILITRHGARVSGPFSMEY